MRARSLIQRIERAEEALKAQPFFSSDCICFPEKERPFCGFPIEVEIADRVKCPLHGQRFAPIFHIYVPIWLREKLWEHLATHHSEQYRKAWFASFPPELWPAQEEEEENKTGEIYLKLKDGSRVLAYEPARTRRKISSTVPERPLSNRAHPLPLSGMGPHEQ